jgi:type IV secretory pathway VirD2 relaxase
VTGDDDFKPKLGKIRSQSSKHRRKYLHRVFQATALEGGCARSGASARKAKFHGSQIGRGASIVRMLATRDRYAAFRSRRVVVKFRIIKLAGNGIKGARAHLRYIQRDGMTRDGHPGELYSAEQNPIDDKTFIERAESDRHQFRFIVAPEDGAEYDELKPFVRRLLTQMEEDFGTRLEWVAVDHYNTGHPHSHIMLRGKDDRGQDLVIAREYVTKGLRERAAELVTLDLGPRSNLEIENRLRDEIQQERLTNIDRRLLRDRDEEGRVWSTDPDAFQQTLRAGRLQKLKDLGLAEEVEPGQWDLADDIEQTLKRMGERGDIIKTMHREMTAKGLARAASDCVIFDPGAKGSRPITGRVVARGLSDEINDRHYLIIDALDGRTHYIDIGKGEAIEPTFEGAIVRIYPKRSEPRQVDRTVSEIAAAHGGRYDVDIHLRHDPSASATYAETYVRRLEAIRRAIGGVEREPNGTWVIGPDHLERAAGFEQRQAQTAPVVVLTLSSLPLEQQISAEGATWLDRELVAETPEPVRDQGFGRGVREALARRRQWLIAQDLAREDEDRIVYRANLIGMLRRRELTRVADQLSGDLGLSYVEIKSGERVEGLYRRHVDLASGRFAVVETAHDFTLVPWRPLLERHLGKQISGWVRGDSISWTIGHQRSGPSIS